ncbi:ion transport protein [Nitzschia inconspicua]|uniref:Ion transport protein n=1 Tax=Nitzschia inconspicua TaxID=303405 RepID=A0A9K3LU64_9STRA|nr:ion transport protein [Nitzschia inconspicua]
MSPPHPYHQNTPPPPPPAHYLQQQRSISTDSKVSDISMDDFATGSALESVFEYSDTSDDMREDSYFLPEENPYSPPSLLGNQNPFPRRPNNPYQRTGGRNDSGESSFRELKRTGSKSSRIVQFSSQYKNDSFSDSEVGDDIGSKHTPQISLDRQQQQHQQQTGFNKTALNNQAHKRVPSGSTMEYAHALLRYPSQPKSQISDLKVSSYEASPLLKKNKSIPKYAPSESEHDREFLPNLRPSNAIIQAEATGIIKRTSGHNATMSPAFRFSNKRTASRVAAYFLMDYEASRPPTLSSHFDTITNEQLLLYQFHFSWPWRSFVNLAIAVLFLSHTQNLLTTAILHTCVILVFAVDIRIKEGMYGMDPKSDISHTERKLARPMVAFLLFLGLESWMWYLLSDNNPHITPPIFSSVCKPLVFFYFSAKARDSLEALLRISRIVMRVLLVEFGLILTFASVACRMFGDFESFHNLSRSWLSLFELSTTVVNPSLWMPVYKEGAANSLFFILFIVTCTFYYHSLVLSVVFQTYIQAITEIHERSSSDREEAVRLSFLALMKNGKNDKTDYISVSSVRKCLQLVRPHYNALKMKALMEIVDPSNERVIDYPSYRTKIRASLNASIRTSRASTNFAMGVELLAVVVAVLNFIYVLSVTSEWNAAWFEDCQIYFGAVLTLLGLLELTVRFNPLRFQHFAPITRLDPFFDGLALVAALISCLGVVQYAACFASDIDTSRAIDVLLLGRAIDMIRVMRFFPIFRDVVRRSSDVLPALAGPLVLMLSVIHIFVFAGMVIWGGAIDVERLMANEDLTPLYCLNNFNGYTTGLVTVFNVAVVNDWHAIAEVYLYADRNSSPLIVYTFFIVTICITVFIMLNVITAFFVESFVTKNHDAMDDDPGSEKETSHREFQIRTGENTNVKKYSGPSIRSSYHDKLQDDDDERSSESVERDRSIASNTSSGEIFFFDIYEREGFDQIMRTVAGSSDAEQEMFARNVCHYLEMFESLTIGREKVGYMVCCQQSLNRFGNRRFQISAQDFISNDTLHKVVSDMHSEVLVLSIHKKKFQSRCLVRNFPHPKDPSKILEISATLLRYQPAATLLVSRIRPKE